MTLSNVSAPKAEVIEKTTRDLVISGVVGLFTGALIGVPLSMASYLMWKKIGVKGAGRWWAWAATGLVGAPFSLAVLAGLMGPSATRQTSTLQASSSGQNRVAQSSSSNTEQNRAAQSSSSNDVKVGEFQTKDFQYTNVRLTPYQITNSFVAQQANVAGKLYEITADVTNLSKESKAPQLLSIGTSDSQGRTFKEADFMVRFEGLEKGQKASDYVLPGQTRQNIRLSMVDVSPDSIDLTLKINGSMFGGSQTVRPIQ
jgi:hypothetical protein